MLLATMLVRASTEANRTRSLYCMYSAFIFTELVGPPFARSIAKLTIWLRFGLGVAFLCTCFVLLAAMPDSTSYAQDAAPVPDSDGEPTLKVSSVLYTHLAEILASSGRATCTLRCPCSTPVHSATRRSARCYCSTYTYGQAGTYRM
jgi:hypothetical protein